VLAIALFWSQRIWLNWVLIGWVQMPLAWGAAALVYSGKLLREKETLRKELATLRSARAPVAVAPRKIVAPAEALAGVSPVSGKEGTVAIRDFELLEKIGEGAYGEVWLARNLVGAYRAIKIVYRRNFSEQRPFEREFEGVRNFGTISDTHPGWVSILHIGKDEAGGFFYYVMEPADDLFSGHQIDPKVYTPKTLGKMLVEVSCLSVPECIYVGVHLADALAALHKLGLVHRDVKPSNIIFVNDLPKLADVGLVAHLDGPRSQVGTEGFIPLEGAGSPLADVFGLGRVLYQAATGCAPARHPGLPTSLGERNDAGELMRLMKIINKACASFHGERYQSASELHDDLRELQLRLAQR
ncbi:MAG: serine/threonine-protein kinase, partial [Limisphaerales bacterium]